jgi:hypothetical protein
MSYVVVDNFSAGLDTRRHPLTAKAGTLQKLDNAHVSRGGEIEKRKAFVSFADLSGIGMTTYGMEATSTSIVVFGSDYQPSYPPLPAGVTYQRLDHPDGLSMTGVVYSTLYGGKTFVVAKYSDGSTYPFFDGAIIPDFVNGVARNGMTIAQLVASLAANVNAAADGYTATASGNTVTVTGPAGTVFTPSATADSPLTVTVATSVPAKTAVADTPAVGSFAVAGGTDPVKAAKSRTLRNIGTTDPQISAVYVNGVAMFSLSSAMPYTASGADHYDVGQRLAYAIAYNINLNTASNGGYTGVYTQGAYLSGNDNGAVAINSPTADPANYNGQVIEVEFLANPTSVSSISELIDTTTIVASPYNAGRYVAQFGSLTGGANSAITSVKVDGVEVMGSRVQWTTSNTNTMSLIATAINSYTSTVEYTASVADGKVVITGLSGTGTSCNGRVITVSVEGSPVIGNVVVMSGGKNGVAAVAQVSTYTVGGTISAGKKVTLVATANLDPDNPFYWGATRVANTTPYAALTFKTKVHLTSGSSLFFSGVNTPTQWDRDGATKGAGSGFINMSNNFAGNEVLTGLALYQGYVAVFARRTVQVWGIDTDPANNKQGQVISNTGALGPMSIVSVGEMDVFYLSDSGIRSVRARDASNAAVVNDVGTPVDSLILSSLSGMTDAQKSACPAVIEPIDGRYWIAIGDKVYVYSYFPNSQVTAWSTYSPGFSISKFTVKDARIYARSGNVIYLYGGTDNATYDSSPVEVILPYLDGGKPAHMKRFNGIDMTVDNTWLFQAGFDPTAPTSRDPIATVSAPTFGFGRVGAAGMGTHVGVRLTCSAAGYARVANIVVHFDLNEAD